MGGKVNSDAPILPILFTGASVTRRMLDFDEVIKVKVSWLSLFFICVEVSHAGS